MEFLMGNSNISDFKSIAIELVIAIFIGIVINIIYRKSYKGVSLSSNFANTLTGLTVISYFIIRCITNNTLLSLGMVGALSIVRFRNSVKDSIDIMFAFWAISEGIIVGAQEYLLSFLFLVSMSLIVVLLNGFNKTQNKKMIIVVKYDNSLKASELEDLLKNNFSKFYVKEQNLGEQNELIAEVKFKNKDIIDLESMKINGIIEISMIDFMEPLI